jgi:hypothetical protein
MQRRQRAGLDEAVVAEDVQEPGVQRGGKVVPSAFQARMSKAGADLDEIIDDPLWKPDTVEGAHRRPLGRVPLEVL